MSFKRLLLPILFLTLTGVSRADTLLFTLAGVENATFELSSTPGSTDIFNVPVTTASGTTLQRITFFTQLDGGGIADSEDGEGYYGQNGQQIYSDGPDGPTFAPGFFIMSSGSENGPFNETLTISIPSTVPEPSSFALLFSGMAAAGATVRRKGWLARTRSI